MSDRFRIALAQLNPVMGDIAGNAAKARAARDEARAMGADLVMFSELFITGYPPEDLVLKPALQADARAAIESLAADSTGGPAILIGAPWVEDGKLYNAFLLLEGGRIAGRTLKVDLPNYGVFDEKRVFASGPSPKPFTVGGIRIGVPVCEDIWTEKVTGCLKDAGAEILAVPNGSPFEAGKEELRLELARSRARETRLPLIYLNQLGGQDELVFDGASFVVNADGALACRLPGWREKLVVTDWARNGEGRWVCAPGEIAGDEARASQVYHAMMLGLRDYVNKNRFPGVVLGLSGGINSALSAAVAVDALGAERVRCVMLPSRYTSRDSLEDADACALALGVPYETIEIERAVAAMGETLSPAFAGKNPDTTEENIQSRLRGVILMAISNKFGPMVLTTGNKSEMSVGYATLYGDMCGGYNVLKDIYKTEVFALARWRNEFSPEGALGPRGRVIPERIIEKPPTAELRANQTDQDSLPPYEILDGILECLVEKEMSFEDTVAKGYEPATVKRVEQLLYVSEYKRRQAPPGVKISSRNFGRDRRYPITNAFRDFPLMAVIVRFAPSPTGLLHVGNARTALLNYLFARKLGGKFLLRIDDTDAARSKKEFEEAIYRDLGWLGIRHDLTDRQLGRLKIYSTAFYRLQAKGRVYPCYETEAELERQRALLKLRKLPPIYDRAALKLTEAQRAAFEAEGRKPYWRFKLSRSRVAWSDLVRGPVEIDTATMSDPVLVREDGAFLYTLPSVADDIDYAISHVVRGEDHVTNTAAQIEIFQALDAAVPAFAHFPLLVGAGGEALSKRLGSLSLESLREDGMEPVAVAAYLAKIGTSDAIEPRLSVDELAQEFDFAKIGRAPAHFDPAELAALNARTLHQMPYDAHRLGPMGVSETLWNAIRPNLSKLSDAKDLALLVTGPITPVLEDAALAAKAAALLPPEPWDEDTWPAWTKAISAETGIKGRGLFHPLRLALTGRGDGPELKKLLPLIGRARTLARLEGKPA